MIPSLWRSIRPTQWVKNLVVFAGLVFSQRYGHVDDVLRSIAAFAVFCALASAVYLFNDIRDRENDRAHPQKKTRPIAAGDLPIGVASGAAVILALAGLAGAWWLGTEFLLTAAAYLVLNLAYSAFLKRVAIVDVMIIALGFVIRAVAGAAAIDVAISSWLIVCTTFLALFLGLGKRRGELLMLGDEAANHRAAMARYSALLLDQFIAVTAAATVLAYALYTLSPETVAKFETNQLIWTLPIVLFGVFRYLYLIHGEGKGGSPTTAFLTDSPLLIAVLLWLATVLLIISQ
jgi:4-hydroxybenzoate polyprenyltransferase